MRNSKRSEAGGADGSEGSAEDDSAKKPSKEDVNLEKLKKLLDERDLVEKQCKELQATLDDRHSSKET